MQPLSQCRLYTFVDTAYLNGRDPAEIARALCAGGSDIIQLRAKDRSEASVAQLAETVLLITQAAGVHLVINDFPSIARSLDVMCHLGQEDFFDAGHQHVDEVKGSAGVSRVGLSTHAPEQAQRAMRAGADYIAIGPVYATGTKPTAKPVTLDYVAWAAREIPLPWFAIGGINLSNLEEVLTAGARRICIVSAILNAPDIARACQSFKERLTSAPL